MTFDVMLARRRRIDRALREKLTQQGREQVELKQQLTDKQLAIDEVTEQLNANQARIEAMLSGSGTLCIADLIGYRQYREVIVERRRPLEADLANLHHAIQNHEQQMIQTRAEIMKNDGKIAICEKRLAALRTMVARATENLQDEEAQENMVGRWFAARSQAEGNS